VFQHNVNLEKTAHGSITFEILVAQLDDGTTDDGDGNGDGDEAKRELGVRVESDVSDDDDDDDADGHRNISRRASRRASRRRRCVVDFVLNGSSTPLRCWCGGVLGGDQPSSPSGSSSPVPAEKAKASPTFHSLRHRKGVLRISGIVCTSVKGLFSFVSNTKLIVDIRVEGQRRKTAVQKTQRASHYSISNGGFGEPGSRLSSPGPASPFSAMGSPSPSPGHGHGPSSSSGLGSGSGSGSAAGVAVFPEEFIFSVNDVTNCEIAISVREHSSLGSHRQLHKAPITIELRTVIKESANNKHDHKYDFICSLDGNDHDAGRFQCELQWLPTRSSSSKNLIDDQKLFH
jgi:hypothetical protein